MRFKLFLLGLLFPSIAFGAVSVPLGGTGSTTLTGILAGNGTSSVRSVIIGNNLTFTGLTLSATGADGTFSTTSADWWGSQKGYLLTESDPLSVAKSDFFSTTTHANITTLPKLSITKSQVSDFGSYESPLTFSYPLSRTSNTISVVATSTFTAPLVFSAGSNSVSCTAASSGVAGCMSAVDWGLLHTATTTFSAPLVYTGSTNAVTCTSASSGVAGCLTASDWGLLHTATTTFSAPLTYSVSTNAVTCPSCLTGNQTITLSGAVTGTGATSITTSYSGTVGLSTGGTNASLSGANQILFLNSGNTAVSNSANFTFDGTNHGQSTSTPWAQFALSPQAGGQPNILFIGSSTNMELMMDNKYHIAADRAPVRPTVGTCGTGPSISGDDMSGSVKVGTGGVNSCAITFASAYTNAPRCFLNLNVAAGTTTSIWANTSVSTLTIVASTSYAMFTSAVKPVAASIGGATIDYWCMASSTAAMAL